VAGVYLLWFLFAPRFLWPLLQLVPRFYDAPSTVWEQRILGNLIFMALIPALIYFVHIRFFAKSRLGFCDVISANRVLSFKNVLYVTIITLAFAFTYSLLGFAIPFIFGSNPVQMPVETMTVFGYILAGGIIANVAEELIFRGVLWGEYRNSNVSFWKAALATGLFFGLIHSGIISVIDTTFSGIFLYAPLIYFTRSIWAPILHHFIVNSLWGFSPSNFASNQTEFEAFLPTWLTLMSVAVAILIPAAIICGKKFFALNKHNRIAKKELPKESLVFKLTYWILIVAMVVVIALLRV